jgi:hypothetical protein
MLVVQMLEDGASDVWRQMIFNQLRINPKAIGIGIRTPINLLIQLVLKICSCQTCKFYQEIKYVVACCGCELVN